MWILPEPAGLSASPSLLPPQPSSCSPTEFPQCETTSFHYLTQRPAVWAPSPAENPSANPLHQLLNTLLGFALQLITLWKAINSLKKGSVCWGRGLPWICKHSTSPARLRLPSRWGAADSFTHFPHQHFHTLPLKSKSSLPTTEKAKK